MHGEIDHDLDEFQDGDHLNSLNCHNKFRELVLECRDKTIITLSNF